MIIFDTILCDHHVRSNGYRENNVATTVLGLINAFIQFEIEFDHG